MDAPVAPACYAGPVPARWRESCNTTRVMKTQQLKGWRRVASAMWPAPQDPQIFGQLELDAGSKRLIDALPPVSEQPVVVDGCVVARPMLPLSVTIDHRYVDGSDISRALRALRQYLQAPESEELSFDRSQ
jgi:hypothetical protein